MKKSLRLSGILLSLVVSGCSTNDPASTKTAFESTDFVGKFFVEPPLDRNDDGMYCTGFVSGPRSVTTALHCVQDDPMTYTKYMFHLNAVSEEVRFIDVELIDDKKDLVTYRTDVEFVEWLQVGFVAEGEHVKMLSATEAHIDVKDCRVLRREPTAGAFIHDCESSKGLSGSPITNDTGVVGVHLGTTVETNEKYAYDFTMLGDDTDIGEIGYNQEWPHIRPPRHWRPPHIRTSKDVTVCGVSFGVSAGLYYICNGTLAAIPAACTAGTAYTAGTACFASIGSAATACGVTWKTIERAARACIDQVVD